MHGKDRDRDRWISNVRMPFEQVFSKLSKQVRYCGWVKAHAQNFMESFAHNVKRLLKLDSPPLPV